MKTERLRLTDFINTMLKKTGLKSAEVSKTPKSSGFAARSGLCDYRMYVISLRERLMYSIAAVIMCAVIAYTFFRSMYIFFVLAVIGVILYPEYKKRELTENRKRRLSLQFKEAIEILSSFLSAGYSVENAFGNSVGELITIFGRDAMIVKEFKYISDSISMNKPVERLLYEFAERSGVDDIRNFSEIFAAAKRTGGELGAIIEHTTEIIRERINVSEEINNLTASQRYQQRIMNMLPFMIILYIDFTSRGFFDAMYQTVLGKVVMTVCLGLYLAAIVMSEKILDIRI